MDFSVNENGMHVIHRVPAPSEGPKALEGVHSEGSCVDAFRLLHFPSGTKAYGGNLFSLESCFFLLHSSPLPFFSLFTRDIKHNMP